MVYTIYNPLLFTLQVLMNCTNKDKCDLNCRGFLLDQVRRGGEGNDQGTELAVNRGSNSCQGRQSGCINSFFIPVLTYGIKVKL